MPYTPEAFVRELEFYAQGWGTEPSLAAAEQREVCQRFLDFVRGEPGCFERTNAAGHITGSAVIVNRDLTEILLTHHRKLGEWLQLGGHADGDCLPSRVAQREGEEESGLSDLAFVPFGPLFGLSAAEATLLDLDIHWIPPHKTDAGHFHYDARYLLSTKKGHEIQITPESKDLKWFLLEDAYPLTQQWSMHRLFDKVKDVRVRLSR